MYLLTIECCIGRPKIRSTKRSIIAQNEMARFVEPKLGQLMQ